MEICNTVKFFQLNFVGVFFISKLFELIPFLAFWHKTKKRVFIKHFTLSKYIYMQRSTKFLGYPLLRKICFNFNMQSYIGKTNHKTTMWQGGSKIIFVRYG